MSISVIQKKNFVSFKGQGIEVPFPTVDQENELCNQYTSLDSMAMQSLIIVAI